MLDALRSIRPSELRLRDTQARTRRVELTDHPIGLRYLASRPLIRLPKLRVTYPPRAAALMQARVEEGG